MWHGHGQSNTPFVPAIPATKPGRQFRYRDSAMNLFALALTCVAGQPVEELFRKRIAIPIGMDSREWDWKDWGGTETGGISINGGAGNKGRGIIISAAEMARFGTFFLHHGNWRGRQLIPSAWVEASTSPQAGSHIEGDNTPYGFNWLTSRKFPAAPAGTFAALGYNNNVCLIIPAWNMVVVRSGMDGSVDDSVWNGFLEIMKNDETRRA